MINIQDIAQRILNLDGDFEEKNSIINTVMEYSEERVKEANRGILDRRYGSYIDGRNETIQKVVKILTGDVLLTGDELDPKTKMKFFELLERIEKKIVALKDKNK